LRHATLKSTPVARDTIYGICTVTFLLLIYFLSSDNSSGDAQVSLRAQMEEDSRRHILEVVDQGVADEQKGPPLRGVIRAMIQNPDSALSEHTVQQLNALSNVESARLQKLHREYLGQLEGKYGGWEPPQLVREF